MRVLVACEFSGRVRDAFNADGHDAMSCDLLPTDQPGPHYQGDVRAKEIPGYPGYRVTEDGRVQSRWRRGTSVWSEDWRDLSPSIDKKGYPGLTICNAHGRKKVRIHRLVAELFIPNPLNLPCVRHRNGTPSDARACNLAWATYLENEHDKIAHGTWNARNGGARLTPEQVSAIRARCDAGERHQDIAADYGVSRPTVTRIASHTTWRQQ